MKFIGIAAAFVLAACSANAFAQGSLNEAGQSQPNPSNDLDDDLGQAVKSNEESLQEVRQLTATASRYIQAGDAAGAMPYLVRAERIGRDVLGLTHPEALSAISNLAFALNKLGRSSSALALNQEALNGRRALLGDDHEDTIKSFVNYGNALVGAGLASEAEAVFLEALPIARSSIGKTHPDTLSILNGYAASLERQSSLVDAEAVYAEVLQIARASLGPEHHNTIAILNNYALILHSIGREKEAENAHAESIELHQKVFGPNHPETLLALNNYAGFLESQLRYAQAGDLLGDALEASQQAVGFNAPLSLTIQSNYALNLAARGALTEAEQLLSLALRIRRREFGDRHPLTIQSMSNHAKILLQLGRNEQALELLREAGDITLMELGELHPITHAVGASYARALTESGRRAEAADIYAYIGGLVRESLGDAHTSTLYFDWSEARNLLVLGEAVRALPLARQIIQANRGRIANLPVQELRNDASRTRDRFLGQMSERLLLDALWSADDEHLEVLEEAFASIQLASEGTASEAVTRAAAARFAASQGLRDLVGERETLTNAWLSLERTMVEARSSVSSDTSAKRLAIQEQLSQVAHRIVEIDTGISAQAPQFFAILEPRAASVTELRAVLAEDEAILFLVPTTFGTHAMAVTRDDISWVRSDRDAETITNLVEEFRLGLEIQAGDAFLPAFDLELAHELYTDLIAPVEDALKDKSRVYVIADGALSRLPLGTLIASPVAEGADGDDPEVLRNADWLADRYALVQLPSLQSLVYIRSFGIEREENGEVGFTGFGAPVLEGEARLRGARSATLDAVDAASLISELRSASGLPLMNPEGLRKLAALPGTESELQQVRKALGAPQDALYLAERMTEPSIRNADLSKTRILHLATHGFTSEESGETAEPGLVFTPPSDAKPEDDGYLAASEVVGLNLTLAEWVILSACNTASPSGKPGETGLSGLAQAFFYAGAESLLVSHWPVFDDIAPLLTVEALKRSQAGQPRAEALQAAMREIRMNPELDAAHPAVWAPFTLVGEGR